MTPSDGHDNVVHPTVAGDILNGVETLLMEARKTTQPLEIEPYRSRLFELFVTADGAQLVRDDRAAGVSDEADDPADLSADGICRSLARRWGLDMAARESTASQSRFEPDQLEQMRLLWSVMRMWMEWSYAWRRWNEFHQE
ncbi:MAG: hypothetical protein MK110_00580 [Fuerstiella sp.]|nr:hypothetical protein [Fuerstiella sp.]